MADQDRIAEREAVARIVDPDAFVVWGYMLSRRDELRDRALAKADAIITLLRTTHD